MSSTDDRSEPDEAVRVVCIADTHGGHRRLDPPDGDIALFAGDVTRHGSLETLRDFDAFLGELDYDHCIVVAGNHDTCFVDAPRRARELLSHATYLEDETVERSGLRIYGSPWQPRLVDTDASPFAFDLARSERLADKWRAIPDDLDILLTHSPPHGVRDRIYTGDHVGCRALADRLREVTVRLHAFGHAHEQPGIAGAKSRMSLNAATPGGYGRAAVLDVEPDGSVEVVEAGGHLPEWMRERIRRRRERHRKG